MNESRNVTRARRVAGFTAVELAVAIAVIAALVVSTVILVRQWQHRGLQADANASPGEVFEIAQRRTARFPIQQAFRCVQPK